MPSEIKIIKSDTFTSFGLDGKPVEQVRVQFHVDDDGPFFQTFPKEGFTGYGAKQALEAFARELRQLRGQ